MNMKKKSLLLLFVIAAMISFACNVGAKKENETDVPQQASNSEEISQENTTTVMDSNQNTPEPETNSEAMAIEDIAEIDVSLLEDSVQVPEGGFLFRPAKGYQLDISGGIVSMLYPGADPDVGPVIQIMGMLSEQEITTDQLYQQMQGGIGMEMSPAQEIIIDGQKGLLAEISGGQADSDKYGQVLFFVINGNQQFIYMAGSTKADWSNLEPVSYAVMSSIEFTELTPGKLTSNLSSGNYAYTNRNVIRDLDEKDGIVYAATLGGLVTWQLGTSEMMQMVPTNGIRHISANAVTYCEIPEPRILVGTLQGISIYNFNTGLWEQKELAPEDSKITTSKIERLYCDQANHRLIIGYTGLGVLDLNTGDFQHYTDQNGLLWNSITDITVNGNDIWIATGYKGIAKISNGLITTFTKDNGMPDEVAYALEFSDDGTLWVGAYSGLISYKNNTWKLFGPESPAKLANISEIEVASDKSLWVATAPLGSGRLCLYDMATATCTQDYTDLDNAAILALTTNETRFPIFGTSKGLTVLNNDALQQLKTSDQLVSNYVDSLTVAPDGMLFVGTDGGVQVLDPASPDQTWITYQQQSQPSMGGNWASSIAFATDGSAWMSMINGSASRYQNGQWQAFTDIYSYNTVAVDAQGRVWIADDGKGIIVLDENGQQVMTITSIDGLPSDNVQALLSDGNGTMWIGTDQGLAKYENNTLSPVFSKDSKDIPNVYVRALALDPDGNLLIGTFTGVSRFDGLSATTLIDFLSDGYNDARLTSLACSADNEIWIGTDKGLLHGNPEMGWAMMTTRNGLLTNYISALTIDQFDTIWVGGGGSNFDGGGLLHIVP